MRTISAAFAAFWFFASVGLLAPRAAFAEGPACKAEVEALIAQEQKDRAALIVIMADFKAYGLNGLAAGFDDLQDMVDRTPSGEIPDCDGVHYARVSPLAAKPAEPAAAPPPATRVVMLPPSPYPLAAASLGAGYTALSQWADAEQVLARGLTLDPHNSTLITGDALALSRLGQAQKGLDLCDRYLALAQPAPAQTTQPTQAQPMPVQPTQDRARVMRARGYLLGELGRYDEGVAAYREALTLQPGDSQAESGIDYLTKLKASGGRGDAGPAPVPEIQIRPQ